jgi:hypothetical protein
MYPECSVFWVPVTSGESFEQAYLEIGRQLQIPSLEEQKADVKRLVQRHLNQESTGQWLLIFDNADDTDMWFNNPGNKTAPTCLIDYVPIRSRGSIIFTTRNRKAAVKLAQQNVVEVVEMDDETATQVLRKALIDPEILNNQQMTQELLKRLIFLPLAIVQAAAYINENGITLSEYLLLLEDKEQNVIEVLSENFEDEGRYRGLKNPVATTWLTSFERIRLCDSLAADYLSIMSCVDPKAIPQSLLPPAESSKKMVDAIGTPSAYSFVTRRPADQSLDLHRLVHLATRNWLRGQHSLAEWTAKAVRRLADVFPHHDYGNSATWRAYLPHAQYALACDHFQAGDEESLPLLQKFGLCLFQDGRFNDAEAPLTRVIEIRKRVLGPEHPHTLTSINNLASTFRRQGRLTGAEDLEVQIVEISKRVLGPEHPGTLTSMNNLACTWKCQGRNIEALELITTCIRLLTKKLGPDHPNTKTSYETLTQWMQE